MLKRITKREAFKLFTTTDRCIVLCPCKFHPGGPFSMGCTVAGKEYLEKADLYAPRPHTIVKDGELTNVVAPGVLWKGTREKTAWDLMYNNWVYYNVNNEAGRYACYYVEAA